MTVTPSPTAAQDKLTEKDRARGVKCMDPRWGYTLITDLDGTYHPPCFEISACEDLRKRYEAKSYDIFLSTYPKCGTSWMQHVICLLQRGSDTKVNSFEDISWMEFEASAAVNGLFHPSRKLRNVDAMNSLPPPGEETSNLQVWKTHSNLGGFPCKGGVEQAIENGSKLILVSRNPKDVCVSMYHHAKRVADLGYDGDFGPFQLLFLSGKTVYNSFWEWHRDWWVKYEKYPESILWVHYEDMKKDLGKEIRRVAEFMNLERTDEELEKIKNRCTFDSMKAESNARNDFAAKKNHFRKGKTGGWRDVISPEVAEAFDEKTKVLYSECSLRFEDILD